MPQPADDNHSPWQVWPETERALQNWIDALLAALPAAADFVRELEQHTSTRVFDWVDYLALAGDEGAARVLRELGFEHEDVATPNGATAFHHPGGQFPRVLLHSDDTTEPTPTALSLKCDRVATCCWRVAWIGPSAERGGVRFVRRRCSRRPAGRCA